MIIKSIKLKNYRQFREEVLIELGSEEGLNINVIIGSTGAGKTNLSNAIQWCLYGNESIDENIDYGILNLNELESMKQGEYSKVSVEILIEIDNKEEYTLTRERKIIKKGDKAEQVGKDEFLAYFHRTETKIPSYDTSNPQGLVNTLFPNRIREYFFFDGEKLEQYFKITNADKIKQSIFQISQLDLLEKIVSNLDDVIRDYRNDVSRNNPIAENINDEIISLEADVKDIDKQIMENTSVKESLNASLIEFMEKYAKYGGEDAKRRIKDNKEIEEKLIIQNKHLQAKMEEKKQLLVTNSYLFLSYPELMKTLNIFKEAEESNLIPPNITPLFVEELLSKGKCICGQDISHEGDGEKRKHVEKLLEEISILGKEPNKLLTIEKNIESITHYQIKNVLNELQSFNEDIKILSSQIYQLKKDFDENLSIISHVDLNIENFENIETKIPSLRDEIDKASTKIGSLDNQKIEKYKLIDLKQKVLSMETEKNEANEKINKYMNYCISAKNLALSIKEKIMSEIREEISYKTEKYYKELHWKKEEEIKIKIDENYILSTLHNGKNKLGAFSAGENALLAMSFIFALNSVSGFNVPIILDTALGRISTEPRANFAKNLSKYLQTTQIILLLTHSEYSEEVKGNLKEHINYQYELKIKDGTKDLETYLTKN